MMLLLLVIGFLALSLAAYVVSGGADFGVGILEVFAGREERERLRKDGERAIAPIWEANHIWIIVALVILFVAFPAVHVRLTTVLHVPLLLMLVGIVLRGTAFTFRYYDVGDDAEVTRLWSVLFRGGSLLVPFMFGHLAAAMSRGRLREEPVSVWQSYFASWLGLFPFAVGVFVVCLFAFLAAVFLLGEVPKARKPEALTRARRWTVAVVVAGAAVTAAGWFEQVPWLTAGLTKAIPMAAGAVATGSLIALWPLLTSNRIWTQRLLASTIAVSILAGYFGAEYPTAIELQDRPPLTWANAAAPEATLQAMLSALLVASALILPGLAWLYRLFKVKV